MNDDSERILAKFAEDPADPAAFDAVAAATAESGEWRALLAAASQHADAVVGTVPEGRWLALVELLEAILNRETVATERSRILAALGETWERRLRRPDQAVLSYEAAFRVDAGNTRAIESARRLRVEDEDWDEVVRTYEDQLRATHEPGQRAHLLAHAASVRRNRQGDSTAADALMAQARRLAPEVSEPGAFGAGEGWETTVERLEGQLYGTRGARRAAVLFRIAETMLAAGVEPVQAEPYLEEARRLAPGTVFGLTVYAHFLAASGDENGYELTLEQAADAADGADAERVAALLELARLRDGQQRGAGARALVDRALALAPASADALEAARRTYAANGTWADLAAVLERAIETQGSAELRREVARLYVDELGREDLAEPHFRRLLSADRFDPDALRFFARLHRDRGEWESALTTFGILRRHETSPERRFELTREMARIAEDGLDDLDRAIDLWNLHRGQHPEDAGARSELRRMLRDGERWNRLVDVLKADLEFIEPGRVDRRVSTLLEIAEIYRDHLRLPVLVANTYAAVLEADPLNDEAFSALTERYARSGRWTDLATVLRARADVTDDLGEKAGLWRRIGRIERDEAENLQAAARAYETALEYSPGDREVFAALEEIYARISPEDAARTRVAELDWIGESKRADAVRAVLSGPEADALSAGQRVSLLEELVRLDPADDAGARELEAAYAADERWSDYVRALGRRAAREPGDVEVRLELARTLAAYDPAGEREAYAWREVLALEPTHAEAADALSGLLAEAGQWDELEAVAGASGSWDRLVVPLRRAAERSGDAGLFRRLSVVLAERMGDTDGQIAALRAARSVAPRDIATLRALDAALALGDESALRAEVLTELAELQPGPDGRPTRLALATVLDAELDQPDAAVRVLVELIESDPEDSGALERLCQVAPRSSSASEVLLKLKRVAARMPAAPARSAVYEAIVGLADGAAGAPLDAVDYLERLVAEAPTEAHLDRLAALHRTAGRWARLAAVLERGVSTASGPRRDRLALECVEVEFGRLGDASSPLERLTALGARIEEAPKLTRLADALRENERWSAAATLAEAAVDLARDPVELRRARLIAGESLVAVDVTRATNHLLAVCDAAPRSAEAQRAAERLLALGDAAGSAEVWAARAADVFEAAERWPAAANALECLARATPDDVELARRLARIHEERRHDPSSALDSLLRAMPDAPLEDPATVERLARGATRLPEVVRRWRAAVDDERASDQVLLALARVLEDDFDRAGEARDIWALAYDADPTSEVAAEALERLNRRLSADEALADQLLVLAESAGPAERAGRLREAAALLAATPERRAEAIPLFERVLEDVPRDTQSFDGLEAIYRELGDTDGLIDVLRRRVDAFADDPAVQTAAFRALGDAILDGGGDVAAALSAFRRALDVTPGDPAVVARLVELSADGPLPPRHRTEVAAWVEDALESTGAHAELVGFLERRLESADPRQALRMHRRAALAADAVGDDPQRAFHHWEQVVACGGPDAEAIERVVALGARIGATDDVLTLLETALLRGRGDLEAVRSALVRLRIERGERASAVRLLEATLIETPGDRTAIRLLERLYRDAGPPEDLAALLLRKADTEPPVTAARLLEEAAVLFRGAGDTAREASCLLRLHRIDPADQERGSRVLERLDELERWDDLAAALAASAAVADHAGDVELGAELHCRRGRVLEERIGSVPRAIAAYEEALRRRPIDATASEHLQALYGRLGMHDARERVLRAQVEAGDGRPEDVVRLAGALAGQPSGAAAAWEMLAGVPLDTLGLADALRELTTDPDVGEAAALRLSQVCEEGGDHAGAVAALVEAAERLPAARKVQLLDRAGRLYEKRQDTDGAFALALRAVEVCHGDEAIVGNASRLAEKLGRWVELAHALEDVVGTTPAPERRARLGVALAELYWKRLDRPDDALEALDALPDGTGGEAVTELRRAIAERNR